MVDRNCVVGADALKVLFIGGTGRTGSTLVDRLLGSAPGWFSGGELAFLWRLGLLRGGLCACGQKVAECDVWGTALERVFGLDGADAERMVTLRQRFWSIHLPLMAVPPLARRRFDRLEEYPSNVEQLYRSVMEVTGDRVLIDSSKDTHYSQILRMRTDLDVYFLHLVRDPRAISYSWTKRRPEAGFRGEVNMERRNLLTSSTYFYVSDIAAEALWRRDVGHYQILRYEDFVANPAAACARIAEFVGEEIDLTGVLEGNVFKPAPGHTTWGNPNRFETAPTAIRADDAWRSEQTRWRSAAAGALNAPLGARYGYGVTSGARLRQMSRGLRRHDLMGHPVD